MFLYFNADRDIPFDQLTDGRIKPDGVEVHIGSEISGRPTASLVCDGSKLLVRTDDKGMVYRLVPVGANIAHVQYMLDVIGDKFDTVCEAEYDGPYRYVREDIEEPD